MNYGKQATLAAGASILQNTCSKEPEATIFETTANELSLIVSDLREINALLYQFNGRAFGNPPEAVNAGNEVLGMPSPGSAAAIDFLINQSRREVSKIFDGLRNVRKVA